MYQQDLDIGHHDAHTTFFMALHHLHLAAALFDRFTPAEFAAMHSTHAGDVPDEVKGMLASIAAQMEMEAWLSDWKEQAAKEMAAFASDDPAIGPIWDRYEAPIQERLSAAGQSPEDIDFQLGDMAAVLQEYREAQARPKKQRKGAGQGRKGKV